MREREGKRERPKERRREKRRRGVVFWSSPPVRPCSCSLTLAVHCGNPSGGSSDRREPAN